MVRQLLVIIAGIFHNNLSNRVLEESVGLSEGALLIHSTDSLYAVWTVCQYLFLFSLCCMPYTAV